MQYLFVGSEDGTVNVCTDVEKLIARTLTRLLIT